jgi:TRAP-type mannitol/chloroaromatic compound transport system permease small subunit
MTADLVDQTIQRPAARPTPRRVHRLRQIHPLGWVALATLVIATICHTVVDTDYLIGNFSWWHWVGLLVLLVLSALPGVLHHLRLFIEVFATIGKTVAWILAWVVFVTQLFNVITRYTNPLVDRDILIGQVTSVVWQSFAVLFLLGINYGVRDGVNPRIDFWWANYSDKAKARLDFVLHVTLLLPFVWMAMRILRNYAAISLGQRRDGTWPDGWRVWRSWEESGDADQLPVGGIKAMIFVGFVLFALQIFAEIIKTGFVMIGRSDLGEVKKTDAPLRIE